VFDKGNTTADVVTTITLQQDLSTTSNTVVSNVRTRSNFSFGDAFSDALVGGLLLGPVGVFVAVVALPEVTKSIESNANFGGRKFDANFGGTGINLYEFSKVQKRLDNLGQFTPLKDYETNRSLSGFKLTGGEVSVEVLQTAQVLDIVRSDFALTRAAELEFLKSLSEVSSKSYVVKPGDNLWRIVKAEYLDARLFILVSQINGIKRDGVIRPGQAIRLPRWHELCKYFGGNPGAVKEGESLWRKAAKGEIPKEIDKIRTFSGKKNLVYPLEIIQTPPTSIR